MKIFARFLCLISAVCLPLRAAGPGPNIVYILADDLGYGDVQCLNPQRGKIKTPHLDKLASQGKTFTNAHSGSSVCTPTRYGLLTGRYAWRTRLQQGVLDGTDDPPLIAADRLTVAAFLKQHGYATAALGKWHLGFLSEKPPETVPAATREKAGKGKKGDAGLPVGSRILDGPVTRGFDYFWGCSNARTMSGLIENDRVVENISPMTMLPRLGQRAVTWLEEHAVAAKAGKPFFLYLPLTSPHTPILPTPEWQGKSGLGSYGDFVMQTDAVVGEVLAALDRTGLAGNTLVIFTSDNGCSPQAGTAELEKQGHFASGSFRGYKADVWDGGHRVPFLVRWPGKAAPGTTSDRIICHTDFLATCAGILDAPLPANAAEDSISLLPALTGSVTGTGIPPLRGAIVHHSIHGRFSIRQGRWKLNLCPGSGGWGKPGDAEARQQGAPESQLYDIESDPGETRNLVNEQPEVAARLKTLLETYVSEGRSTPGPRQTNDAAIDLLKSDAKSKSKKK